MILQANSFCIGGLCYVGINNILMDGPDYCTELLEYLSDSTHHCLFLSLSQAVVIYFKK